MTRRRILNIALGLSFVMWGWVGYRVLAVQTGKFGPVSLRVTGLDQANKFIQWSPRAENYRFTVRHELILPPKSSALFLLNPPRRFRRGRVAVAATGRINVRAEYPPGATVPTGVSAVRTWRWSDITRFPGGHRLHIENTTDGQVRVGEIQLTFIP